ncbi:MAG: aminomethyltransferase beta-barrel domain-containing protein, partial [Candidatus Paceibacterota bacterium]
TNTVVVAKKNDDDLFKNSIKLYDLNLISPLSSRGAKRRGDLVDNLKVKARIRYRQPLFDALLKRDVEGNFTLEFNNPQKFVAPGQSAVFYTTDGEMIGGGVISAEL